MISAEAIIQVEFYDIDAMQVVWHGNYVRYLELARGALMDKIGYNYPQMKASGYAWPVVDMSLRFTKPAVHGQRLRAVAELLEWENRLKIGYQIYDAAGGQRLTRASTTQVAVDMRSGELCFACPEALVKKVEALKP